MKLSEILEKKTSGIIDLKSLLGDKYNNLDIDLGEENGELLNKNFISLLEAENNAEIISKNKHNWHQVASKSLYDSVDNTLVDHLGLLETVPDKTPQKVKATLDKYKELLGGKDTEMQSLRDKIADLEGKVQNNATPEMKAMLDDKNIQLDNLKKSTIALEEFEKIKAEKTTLEKKIKAIDNASLESKIIAEALSSNMLADFWKENKLRNKMILGVVGDYIKEEKFGLGGIQAKLSFDDDRNVKIVQKDNEDLPVIVDNKTLELGEIVKLALIKNEMIQKSDTPFVQQQATQNNFKTNKKIIL